MYDWPIIIKKLCDMHTIRDLLNQADIMNFIKMLFESVAICVVIELNFGVA